MPVLVTTGRIILHTHGSLFKTECLGDRRTCDVCIEDGCAVIAAVKCDRQHRCDEGFSNAALAADNAYDLFNAAQIVELLDKIFFFGFAA